MPIKTIFLDRDGVINKEVGYLHKIKDFKFIDGVFDACLYFQSIGYQLVIVPINQELVAGTMMRIPFILLITGC